MAINYIVTARTTCQKCHGRGTKKRGDYGESILIKKPCAHCSGAGYTDELTNLRYALRAIGVQFPR